MVLLLQNTGILLMGLSITSEFKKQLLLRVLRLPRFSFAAEKYIQVMRYIKQATITE